MRAPHPALQGLYRQAAAPSQLTARLQRYETSLDSFAVELIAGGRGGEALFERLLIGLELGEVLNVPLARLAMESSPEEVAAARPRQPLEMPAAPVLAGGTLSFPESSDALPEARLARAKETSAAAAAPFMPEAHPRLARMLGRSKEEASFPRGQDSPKVWPAGLPDAASVHEQLTARAERSNTRGAFEQDVVRKDVDQAVVAIFNNNIQSLPRAGAASPAEQPPVRGAAPAARRHSDADRTGYDQNISVGQGGTGFVEQLSPRLAALVDRIDKAAGVAGAGQGILRGRSGAGTAERPRPAAGFPSEIEEINGNAGITAQSPAFAATRNTAAVMTTAPQPDPGRPPAPTLETPVKGWRGLLAFAQAQQKAVVPPATPPLAPEGPGPAAFEDHDLAARIGTALRREAERYGIDIKGTKS